MGCRHLEDGRLEVFPKFVSLGARHVVDFRRDIFPGIQGVLVMLLPRFGHKTSQSCLDILEHLEKHFSDVSVAVGPLATFRRLEDLCKLHNFHPDEGWDVVVDDNNAMHEGIEISDCFIDFRHSCHTSHVVEFGNFGGAFADVFFNLLLLDESYSALEAGLVGWGPSTRGRKMMDTDMGLGSLGIENCVLVLPHASSKDSCDGPVEHAWNYVARRCESIRTGCHLGPCCFDYSLDDPSSFGVLLCRIKGLGLP